MKTFEEIYRLNEKELPTTINHPAMKTLKLKGYKMVILPPESDRELPDVHGIPDDCIAYGRGGVLGSQLWMEGGTQGSKVGHRDGTKDGFYWGAKEESDGGKIYVRGRAGVSERDLAKMEIPIVNWISAKVPRV